MWRPLLPNYATERLKKTLRHVKACASFPPPGLRAWN